MSDFEDYTTLFRSDVPLGGPRGMTVHRTLPARRTSLIGGWCFVDHFGPDDLTETGGMQVARHPHTGLATVSWLFEGAITHRDSIGSHALVRPGEIGRASCRERGSRQGEPGSLPGREQREARGGSRHR